MLLHFFVQARPPGSGAYADDDVSYLHRASAWATRAVSSISDMTMDEFLEKAKTHAQGALDSTKELFRFLSGDPLQRVQAEQPVKEEVKQGKEEKGWTTGFTGLFSGLRGTTQGSTESKEAPDGSTYNEGEVHADLALVRKPASALALAWATLMVLQDDDGYYKFRYLFVDVPSKSSVPVLCELHSYLADRLTSLGLETNIRRTS